jgi:hypothetical protein
MKKQLMCILLSVLAVCAYAQAPEYTEEDWEACRRIGYSVEAPHFFCDCELTNIPFEFPVDMDINDTVWFSGKLSDIQDGFAAYWFGDCTLTLEVYAFCTSKLPTISIDVPANRMKELSNEMITEMLNEMGTTARELAGSLEPRIRVYPHDGGSGHVYGYPFGEGPMSTCEEPIELHPYVTYVSKETEQAYRMASKDIPSKGEAFILWKQTTRKIYPGEIILTLDSCTGEEFGRATMTDTLHVLKPNKEVLLNARKEGRDIWMQVRHDKEATGRVIWYFNPKYTEPDSISQKTCLGKKLSVNGRDYMTDTVLMDTIWMVRDSLQLTYAELKFTEPKQEYDTVWLEPATIRHGYRYQPSGDIFNEFGEYEVEVVKPNTCTRAILLYIGDINHQSLDKTNADRRAKKRIKDGRLVIEMDENIFDVLGQKIINN